MTDRSPILTTARQWTAGAAVVAGAVLCLGSGVLLAFRFDPTQPFESLSDIAAEIPFGGFFRGLHYYSAHVFLVMILAHLSRIVRQDRFRQAAFGEWCRSVGLAILVVLLNLSGFVLRGDLDAQAAGAVFSRLLGGVPLIGRLLEALFFMPGEHPLVTLYLQHVLLLTVGATWLAWLHVARFNRLGRLVIPLAGLIGLLAVAIPPPLGPPPGAFQLKRLGPWYFIGMQEMLRIMPVWLGGLVLPLVFIGGLVMLPKVSGRPLGRLLKLCLGIGLAGYGVLTLWGYVDFLRG